MTYTIFKNTACVLTCLMFASPALPCQQEIWRLQSPITGPNFGVILPVGDINGDCITDFAHRALGSLDYIFYSGKTLQSLTNVSATPGSNNFVISAGGDFNNDGSSEVLIQDQFKIHVYSPMTEQTILSISTTVGGSPTFVGDTDGDAIPDFMVGIPGFPPNSSGKIDMISGATGLPLFTVFGITQSGLFGTSKSTLGDIDGDSVNDIVIGAPGELFFPSGNGEVFVLSGANGSVIHHLTGPGLWSRFGDSVETVGDLDGDGMRDFSVFAPSGTGLGQTNPSGGYGQGFVYSSSSGALLHTYNCGPVFSGSGRPCGAAPFSNSSGRNHLWNVGDLDGDGFEDLAISITSLIYDPVNILSGRNLVLLQTFAAGVNAAPLQTYGISRFIADLTDDDIPEVGAMGSGLGFPVPQFAFVALYSLSPVGTRVFGERCNTGSMPKIGCSGRPEAGHSLTVNVSGISPSSQAHLIVGLSNTTFGPWPLPYPLHALGQPNCQLLVSPDLILPAVTDATIPTKSFASLTANFPMTMSLTGQRLYAQWVVADGTTFSLSRGLELTFF